MEEFEFFGLTNGQAVVRHCNEGHVFRFASPTEIGQPLILSVIERGEDASDDPQRHIGNAMRFAARSLSDTLARGTGPAMDPADRAPDDRPRRRRLWSRRID